MSHSKKKKAPYVVSDSGISGQYKNWFLDYASYVILERAVPEIEDGLKPVQRRILYAMKEMDDGRFNKVANIIGQSMQYHPHGDASIGDAIVNLGQKDLLIETQGNWGDVRTGDSAAAPRYIEARLSKFALEVGFNEKTTEWQLSYDGRKNEPVTLPMKFPLLLAQGAEGIAVGLATKILPHNFCELIDCTIKYYKGKKFELYPDFATEGMIDVKDYQDGLQGGKVKVRCRIEELDKKTLIIRDVPYGITTTQLIDSILKANDSGKIKIKKVTDNTAAEVEIQVDLGSGMTPDMAIDALYAFTNCEISISPNACVIEDNVPRFLGVSELLKHSADATRDLLKKELEIKLAELQRKWHYTSLEKIFFEERIYKELEKKYPTWEEVLEAIDRAFDPFKSQLKEEITREDLLKLTEKPVRRIYRLDIDQLNKQINDIEADIAETNYHLEHLTEFAIAYFENLLQKYGKGKERRTEIKPFDTIEAKQVAIANTKLYMNRAEGFVGTDLKKYEFVAECSDLDDIIVFTRSGKMMVVKVADKVFVGKDIIHAAVFDKNNERITYNMIYTDGKKQVSYGKRFNVTGITREREYDLTKGSPNSKVQYFSVNPNGEAETVMVKLSPSARARKKEFDYSFEQLEIRNRSAYGNIVTKYPIRSVKLLEKGQSTLEDRQLWFDHTYGKLNDEGNGTALGDFKGEDQLLVIYQEGSYEIIGQDLLKRFDPSEVMLIEKYDPSAIITAVYLEAEKAQYNVKRFKIETSTVNTKFSFIKNGKGNKVVAVTTNPEPVLSMSSGKGAQIRSARIRLYKVVEIMGWKAVGNKLADFTKTDVLEWYEPQEPPVQGELF